MCLDNNKFACGVFIDPWKAFDTVKRNILLSKLEYYGILLWDCIVLLYIMGRKNLNIFSAKI